MISPQLDPPFKPLEIVNVPATTPTDVEPPVTTTLTTPSTTAGKWNGRAETRTRTFGVHEHC